MKKLIFLLVLLGLVSGCGPSMVRQGNELSYGSSDKTFIVHIDETFSFRGDSKFNSGLGPAKGYVFSQGVLNPDKMVMAFIANGRGVGFYTDTDQTKIYSKVCPSGIAADSCFTFFNKKECSLSQIYRYYPDGDKTIAIGFIKDLKYSKFPCAFWTAPQESFSPEQEAFLKEFTKESERLITVKIEDRRE